MTDREPCSSFLDPIDPKIVQSETQRFLAIMGRGPFETCGEKFRKLADVATKEGLVQTDLNQMAMLVLCDVRNTEKDDLEWACGLRVPTTQTTNVPEGLEEIVVMGRRCVTALHKGSYSTVARRWGGLCMQWIPSQNLKPATGSRDCPHFEVYLNNPTDVKEEDLLTQLYCPIE